ncbi:GntR family transcriptional regulator [Flaviflexus salsibiostraticola]|uniref:GntR family transcriptional regulator n=1 Tax=Flaviflexus salsibiostraticola TaxID=1282737 RepID=A0A3Q8WSI2_9ACTO|nr:GntR family transcriptional regulator [Flaviflexus salsibiostraticola]AZN29247.1 GntR family transcriptional regulator [Flaviflexus salsibiostraticola]
MIDMARNSRFNDAIPLHAQMSESVMKKIRQGELPVGSRLPGEAELMRIFGISRGTVRRSIKTLNEAGYVQTIQGKGTFVLTGLPGPSIGQKLVGIGEALSFSGKNMETSVISQSLSHGRSIVNPRATLDPEERILVLDRVRALDGIPVARLHNWVRADLAPGIEDTDFESTSLFHALDSFSAKKVTSGQRSFEAVTAPDEVAVSLAISPFSPLLFIRQTTFLDDGTPIEWSDVWMDSKQLAVTAVLSR